MPSPVSSYASAQDRSLLVVGHPGHELRVYGWMVEHRPDVVVITDGSGHSGRSRTPSTRKLLSEAGANAREPFGSFTDVAIYGALIQQDFALIDELLAALVTLICSGDYGRVLADAYEGYNPAHDLCRVLIDAAVDAARIAGIHVENLAFSLISDPRVAPVEDARTITLDQALFERKLATARAYPGMRFEVEAALRAYGEDAFRYETVFPAGRCQIAQQHY